MRLSLSTYVAFLCGTTFFITILRIEDDDMLIRCLIFDTIDKL
jgi:hypothetical protein